MTHFTNHHASELLWRYGEGASRVTRMSNAPPESGVRGKGHSSTKGYLGTVAIDLVAMERFGKIDRALTILDTRERDTLALAYGDAGAAFSGAWGLTSTQRWRAVAVLTTVAATSGKAWVRPQKPRKPKKARDPKDIDERLRDPSVGSPAARWVNHILSLPQLRGDDLEAKEDMQREACAMLEAAKMAFARAYDRVCSDEIQIERHARVSAQRR